MQEFLDYLTKSWPQAFTIATAIKFSFAVYAVGLLIEYFAPAEKNQASENIRFNIVYTVFFITVNTFLFGFLIQIKSPLVEFFGGPFFALSFDASIGSQVLHVFSFLFIFDFFYYWFHRFQHKSTLLWAQHQFHHADTALNITTGNRHHWLEDSLRIFIILIPMSVLFSFKSEHTGLIWSGFMLWGYFIHLNLKLDLRWLTPVFGGPQLHRIHHSNLKPHLDKNFAAFFPIYDIVFGSFYWPKKDEYPTTGLYDGLDMNSLSSANFYPFQYWFRRLKKRFSKTFSGQ
ncbi:MAG: sterol desaturase family protein [Proteobacteria bacterium]|nr:sterol desaturase family protein [Pseudomonadota bacterium]